MPVFWRLILIVALPLLIAGCGERKHPYRLAFEVEVDGLRKSASTIQNVRVFETGDANGKRVTNTATEGVPAVMDLGPYGWLVVGGGADWTEWKRRKEKYDLSCKEPRSLAAIIPDAGGRNGTPQLNPTELPWWNMPTFVWFPAGHSYTEAQQLCPEEFVRVIGEGVKLVKVSVVEEPNGKVESKLDLQAPWLDEMRADTMNGTRSRRADEVYVFKPRRSDFEHPRPGD